MKVDVNEREAGNLLAMRDEPNVGIRCLTVCSSDTKKKARCKDRHNGATLSPWPGTTGSHCERRPGYREGGFAPRSTLPPWHYLADNATPVPGGFVPAGEGVAGVTRAIRV